MMKQRKNNDGTGVFVRRVENNHMDAKPIGLMRVNGEVKPSRVATNVKKSARPRVDRNKASDVARDSRISSSSDSDGPGVVTDEDNSPYLSTPTTAAAISIEGLYTSMNVQMSPDKALRAAMLKRRFADTIFKATHQNAEKLDPLRMHEDRLRLEGEKQQEKTRIEAEIKAAEAAVSRKRKQNELKTKRKIERAAAKMALQKMERTVDIYESLDITKEVDMLSNSYLTGKPLERLGLYLKVDYLNDDAILNAEEGEILMDVEEGEIIS
ncbi:hypothetical protein CASFOL_014392 [Castilleja foliolosa]|uniref:Uncharacterized protein n=1 Tax=Castilleja foliolosa TaxID=1961234 RepID=A0ABD3DQF3_9LAMI